MTEHTDSNSPNFFKETASRVEMRWWEKMDLYGPDKKPQDGPNVLELKDPEDITLGYVVLHKGVNPLDLTKIQTADSIVRVGIGHSFGQTLAVISLSSQVLAEAIPEFNKDSEKIKKLCLEMKGIWQKDKGKEGDDFAFRLADDQHESDHTVKVLCQGEELGRLVLFPHLGVDDLPNRWLDLVAEFKDMEGAIQKIAQVKHRDLKVGMMALNILMKKLSPFLENKHMEENINRMRASMLKMNQASDKLKRKLVIDVYVGKTLKVNLD